MESDNMFAGNAVFDVDSESFSKARLHKGRYQRFKSFISDEDKLSEIRDYSSRNPRKSIVVRDESTGSYRYLKKVE